MKKILMLLITVCAIFACDPVQEDISNGGNITVDELMKMTTVTLDKVNDTIHVKTNDTIKDSIIVLSGNVLTCTTSAAVNAKWSIDGKDMLGNYAWKKLKLGEHTVTLTGLCADGSVVSANYSLKVDTITNPLDKKIIFQPETPYVITANGDASWGRFSANEGKGLPYLTDDVYFGKKTLIFDVDVQGGDAGIWGEGPGPVMIRLMTGWWDPVFADEVLVEKSGLWELQLTDEIADACAQGAGSRDLTLLLRRGTMTIKSIYYEE